MIYNYGAINALPLLLNTFSNKDKMIFNKEKHMKIFTAVLSATALLLFSFASNATSITFTSGLSDHCTAGCATMDNDWYTYVDPDESSALSGASWIQPEGTWMVDGVAYSIVETDFSDIGDSVLTSLYVSFDDDLLIYNGGHVIFDSLDAGISSAWTQVVDVFDYLTDTVTIYADDSLMFAVVNSLDYETGVVWKGTVDVPEPSTVFLLGLALIAFGVKHRKNSNV